MLEITIPKREYWDEKTEEFSTIKSQYLQLEHSLVSLYKWESKWHKPFLGKNEKTNEKTIEETIDYIRCMTITQNVDPNIYINIPNSIIKSIKEYIEAPMTATWFSKEEIEKGTPQKNEIITAEIIYYWMIAQNIPMECQKWHLNKLLTLIRVCSIKNQPPSKGHKNSKGLSKRKAINDARRQQLNTKG